VTTTGKAILGVAGTLAIAVGAFLAVNVPHSTHYWGSDQRVAAYLRSETPLGSSVTVVQRWLQQKRLEAAYSGGYIIRAGSDFPPTKVGGSGFIQTTIASYGWPFETAMEGFYIFDSNERLCDITIRRTVDAI